MKSPKGKKYYEVTEDTESADIFPILDAMRSDNVDDLDNVMNDSDTEFVATVDICLDSNDTYDENILTPSANLHNTSEVVIDTTSSTSEPGPSQKGASAPEKKGKKEPAWKWSKTPKLCAKQPCVLTADVLVDTSSEPTPFKIFSKTVDLNKLIAEISVQTNFYTMQNGRQFITDEEEIRAFLGMNYIMAVNKLPNIEHYWSVDKLIGNPAIRDITTQARFIDTLRNLHFSNNETSDLTDKGNKVHPVMNHSTRYLQQQCRILLRKCR